MIDEAWKERIEKVLHPKAAEMAAKFWRMLRESSPKDDDKWSLDDEFYVIAGAAIGVLAKSHAIMIIEGAQTMEQVQTESANEIKQWFLDAVKATVEGNIKKET